MLVIIELLNEIKSIGCAFTYIYSSIKLYNNIITNIVTFINF